MESEDLLKFDMGGMCEYCCGVVVGIFVIIFGNILIDQDTGDNISIVGIIIMIAGISIIACTIAIAFIDRSRNSRRKEASKI